MTDDAPEAEAPPPAKPPLWKERGARWGAPLLALITAYTMLVRAHWHYVRPFVTPVSNDEGYISAMAVRMLHGRWLPYVDAVSQRGPVLYWVTAAAMKIGGEHSWLPIRWLSFLFNATLHALVFAIAAELFGPFAAAVAILFTSYFFTYELMPWDGVGFNGELVAMTFAMASMLLVARAQRRPDRPRRGASLVVAGVFAALAGLSKQMTLIHLVPSALWLALGPEGDERRGRRERLGDLARFFAGLAGPYAVVLTIYAATGHLREFVYYYQRYGRDIFMDPLTREYMRDKLREQIDKYFLGISGLGSLFVFAVARWVRSGPGAEGLPRLERLRRRAAAPWALGQCLCALAGACFTWRFFPHYFVQFFPAASLVAAYAVSERYDELDLRRPSLVASAFVAVAGASILLAVGSSALTRQVRNRRETDRWYQDPQTDPIVRYVLEKTRPTDTLFVWGFRAETYVSSGRFPASRFVYTVYPSGVVPWFQATREEEERRVVPGSREQLLDDLRRWEPELVIDAGRSMNGRYMYNYPVLRAYIDQNYCFMRYVDGEPVYRRRHGEHCPPADY